LRGGPSHLDTFDPKPGAPTDIRGPFQPIATNVPGIRVSEILPLQAKIMDRLAIVRNLRFGADAHNGLELLTGHAVAVGGEAVRAQAGRWPAFGSVLSRLQPAWRDNMPPYVSLLESIQRSEAPEDPGWLGAAHRPFYFDSKHKSFFNGVSANTSRTKTCAHADKCQYIPNRAISPGSRGWAAGSPLRGSAADWSAPCVAG
jgi:hypothetical protein